MSDRKRQLRKLLERYRDRAAAITLEIPELQAIAARQGESDAAVAESRAPVIEPPAPAAERPAPVAERPAPAAERPAPAAKRPPEPDDTPAPPRRPAPAADAPGGHAAAYWLAVLFVAALAGGGWLFAERAQGKNSHRVVSLPLSSSVGLARRGIVLYSFDRARSRMAAIDSTSGGLLSVKRFPNVLASGLAASPDKLWSADTTGLLYEHGLTDDYAVRRTFANPDRRPSALHWDGSHLWIADARTNSLYEYTVGASLVPARQFTLAPGMAPVGLHVESGLLWVLDANSRAIHRYRVRALLEPVDSLTLQPWISAPRRPSGMIVDGQVLWISTDGTPELHRFELRKLPWRADS